MNPATARYPLAWPAGVPRTDRARRKRGTFRIDAVEAERHLIDEVTRLGADEFLLSTNVRIKPNGFPYANDPPPADPGVAAYFTLKGEPRSIACDAYDTVRANVRALALCIESLRALERHGSPAILERAFRGFAALPETASGPSWWDVLGCERAASEPEIRAAYRARALEAHPDKPGGSEDAMHAITVALEQGLAAVGAS